LCYGVFWFWFSSRVSEREKNGKEYNESNYGPWFEDEESPHFLDDEERREKKREREDLFRKLLGWLEL